MKGHLPCSAIVFFMVLVLLAAGCLQNLQPVVPRVQVPAVPTSAGLNVTPLKTETKEVLVAFVRQAVDYARTEGKEKALAEFNKKNGSFFKGQLYLYVYDFNGTTLAHPVNPEKIGVNRLNEKDAAGNLFIRDLRDMALNGSGFVEYYYINPTHDNAIEKKLGYVMKVDDTWFLGSGIYAGSAGYAEPGGPNVPVTSGEVKKFVDDAAVYAWQYGKDAAIAEYNNRSGNFIRGDLYVFAYDYSGNTLAYPYRPDLIGVNRINATDITGKKHILEMVNSAKNGTGIVYYYSQNPFRNNSTGLKMSYVRDIDGTWFIGTGTYTAPGLVSTT